MFTTNLELEKYVLAETKPIEIMARDGLMMPSYLTQVKSTGSTIVLVHGGPWGRDKWSYSSVRQWLANRGYNVIEVNFRGSIGFGKEMVDAGNRQWSLKM